MSEPARPFWGTCVNVLNFSFSDDLSTLCPFVALDGPRDMFAVFLHTYPRPERHGKDGYAQPAFRLSERCLIAIDVTEYSRDWQGGDWPLEKNGLVVHGHEEYPILRERMIDLYQKHVWGRHQRIKRGLSEIKLWITGNYPTDGAKLLQAPRQELFTAESIHVKLTFR